MTKHTITLLACLSTSILACTATEDAEQPEPELLEPEDDDVDVHEEAEAQIAERQAHADHLDATRCHDVDEDFEAAELELAPGVADPGFRVPEDQAAYAEAAFVEEIREDDFAVARERTDDEEERGREYLAARADLERALGDDPDALERESAALKAELLERAVEE